MQHSFAGSPAAYTFVGNDASQWSLVVERDELSMPWSNENAARFVLDAHRVLSGDMHWETETPVAV